MEALGSANRTMSGAMAVSTSAQVALHPITTRCVQFAPRISKSTPQTSFRGRALRVATIASPLRPVRQVVECEGLGDFVGGDLLGFDLDAWVADVENFGSLAVYAPPEGGYEGRYVTRLKGEGYHFMNISARGLGDPESYLTKVHGVRPPHLGRQAIVRWYHPPEVDYRLSLLPKNCKGLVLWVLEAKVLSKSELQYLALLPAIRPNVKVIAECGSWGLYTRSDISQLQLHVSFCRDAFYVSRVVAQLFSGCFIGMAFSVKRKYKWKPLKDVAGIPASVEK